MQTDKAIRELRDRITGLDRELIIRAADIKHFFWLYLEGNENDTLVNFSRRNDAGNIEINTVNRTNHTNRIIERTPEEFDVWRKRLERM